mgnify:CR=1 FL=1|jgi:hypothetical protein
MALKNGKVNALNALEMRRYAFPAHHFTYTNLFKYNPGYLNAIDNWIYNNLNGRYYVGQYLSLSNNTLVYVTRVGFEQEKELSFFKLACPLSQ